MAKSLTDVDTFTTPVVVPEDGDSLVAASVETPFQALANRTLNLDKRTNPEGEFYRCAVLTTVSASSPVPFPDGAPAGTGFSVASYQLTCPRSGLYLVSFEAYGAYEDTSNPALATIQIRCAATPIGYARGARASATITDNFVIVGSALVEVTTPVSDVIDFYNVSGSYGFTSLVGAIYAHRLGADV
jgi:hypothetical protein